jgi:hypothetical protein
VNISNVYLNFSSGVLRRDVVVTILDDDMFEADEALYLIMSGVNTSDANIIIDVPMATVVIINNDRKKNDYLSVLYVMANRAYQ